MAPDAFQEYEVQELRDRIIKLESALIGTRVVLQELRKMSPEGLHQGFDMWESKIDEALKNGVLKR